MVSDLTLLLPAVLLLGILRYLLAHVKINVISGALFSYHLHFNPWELTTEDRSTLVHSWCLEPGKYFNGLIIFKIWPLRLNAHAMNDTCVGMTDCLWKKDEVQLRICGFLLIFIIIWLIFRGNYTLQPKAFIGKNILSGPKIKVSIQADTTKPIDIAVNYDEKMQYTVGETLTGDFKIHLPIPLL